MSRILRCWIFVYMISLCSRCQARMGFRPRPVVEPQPSLKPNQTEPLIIPGDVHLTCDVLNFDSCMTPSGSRCGEFGSPDGGSTFTCNCDFRCVVFGDCCHDYKTICTQTPTVFRSINKANIMIGKIYRDGMDEDTSYKGVSTTCHMLDNANYGIWMTRGCPQSWTGNERVLTACENDDAYSVRRPDTLPVTAKGGMVYKNVYCALCNGVEQSDVEIWSLEMICSIRILNPVNKHADNVSAIIDVYENFEEMGYCKPLSYPVKGSTQRVRVCLNAISQCNSKNFTELNWNNDKCEDSHTAAVYDIRPSMRNVKNGIFTHTYYKNKFCAQCDNPDVKLGCGLSFIEAPRYDARTISTLFNYNPDGQQQIRVAQFKSQHLRRVEIAPLNLTYGACIFEVDALCRSYADAYITQLPEVTVTLQLLLSSSEGDIEWFIHENETEKRDDLIQHILKRIFNTSTSVELVVVNVSLVLDSYTCSNYSTFNVDVTAVIQFEGYSDLYTEMLPNLTPVEIVSSNMNVSLRSITVLATEYNDVCSLTENWSLVVSKQEMSSFIGTTVSNGVSHSGNSSRPILFWESFQCTWQISNSVRQSSNGVCHNKLIDQAMDESCEITICGTISPATLLSCDGGGIIILKDGEYIKNDNVITWNENGMLLKSERFIVSADHINVFVCAEDIIVELIFQEAKGLKWVTVALFCLSVIALIYTIAYLCVPIRRRKFAIKLVINLCVALCLAEALLVTTLGATDIPWFCKGVAVATHYIWLVSFFWMGIISFDIMRVFVVNNPLILTTHTNYKQRLAIYCLVGWAGPAIFIAVAAFLDFCQCTPVSIGYGELDSCWIGNSTALLITFHGPVAVILLFNTVSCILSNCMVRKRGNRHTKNMKFARVPWQKRHVRMVFGTVAQFGLVWTLGFVEAFVDNAIFSYFFTILSSLQGVVLFIFFVCNDIVLRKRNMAGTSSLSKTNAKENVTIIAHLQLPGIAATPVDNPLDTNNDEF